MFSSPRAQTLASTLSAHMYICTYAIPPTKHKVLCKYINQVTQKRRVNIEFVLRSKVYFVVKNEIHNKVQKDTYLA